MSLSKLPKKINDVSFSAFRQISHYPVDFSRPATHLYMLCNTEKYNQFAFALRNLVAEKTVLEIGTGSGVLALLCASLGAYQVVTIERPSIVNISKEVLSHFPDANNIIEVVDNDFFDYESDIGPFDIIISETIGYVGFEENIAPLLARAQKHFGGTETFILPHSLRLVMRLVSNIVHAWQKRPTLANRATGILPFQRVNSTEPFVFGKFPPYEITIEHIWRTRKCEEVSAVSISFEAELIPECFVTNWGSAFWPHCIIPFEESIRINSGTEVAAVLSLRPVGTSYAVKVILSIGNTEFARCEFNANEIQSTAVDSYVGGTVDDVAKAVKRILLSTSKRRYA